MAQVLEGAEDMIAAIEKLKEMDPDWKIKIGDEGAETYATADEIIEHLRAGDEFARNLLSGLGDLAYALLAGSGATRPSKQGLTGKDVLSAIEIIKKTSPPQTVTIVSLQSEQQAASPNHKEMTVSTTFSLNGEQFQVLIKGNAVKDLGIAAKNATLPEKDRKSAIFTFEELAERFRFASVAEMMKKVENVQIPKKAE